MPDLVQYHSHPKLTTPVILAAWPGISNVSLLVATYLYRKLKFRRLATIDAAHFFDPIGVNAKNNVVEAPQFPQSKFWYWKNHHGKSDIILFIGDDQPATQGYELANCVLDVARNFKVKRVYTFAAAPTKVHHSETPKVWGVATTARMTDELIANNLLQRGNLQIAGLNGLLLGVAKEKHVEGMCLVAEVPSYASRLHNPVAALEIVNVLCTLLDIRVDIIELTQLAEETKVKMKELAAQAMEEYIDLFTEPIWEQGQEDDEEEEDEN